MKIRYIISKNTWGIALVLFMLMQAGEARAQTQQFTYTQYMDNLTPFNPAYSMVDNTGSVNTMARKQWVGIPGAPTTFLFNGNIPIEPMNAAAGVIVLNDQFAVERQTEVNAYFAKAIQMGPKDYLAVSLNAGIRNYVANYTSLDSSDPAFANDVRQTKPNVGFGIMYYTDWYYLGLSLPELSITGLGTASLQSNSNFVNHYYFSGALITTLDEDLKFKPAMLFSYAQGVPLIADFSGIFYLKDIVGIGLDLRTNSEMAGMFSINFDAFHIGYSYQFNNSAVNLGGINNATHEVTLSYRFGKGAATPKLL